VEAMKDFCRGYLRWENMPSISSKFAHNMGLVGIPGLEIRREYDSITPGPSKPSLIKKLKSQPKESEILKKLKKLDSK
jgi:hypothetical protein